MEYLTFFALARKNLSRPIAEVTALLKLSGWLFTAEVMEAIDDCSASVSVIGGSDHEALAHELTILPRRTRRSPGLHITFAINHSSRVELSEAIAARELDVTATTPDVDLLIRPGGEQRLSDFLLWHIAHAEFVFTDTLWPDFRGLHLTSAIFEYQHRRRRFGQ